MLDRSNPSPTVRDTKARRTRLVWKAFALVIAVKLGWLVLIRDEGSAGYAALALVVAVSGLLAVSAIRWLRTRTTPAEKGRRI